jgi:hypothetical protein
VAGYEAVQDDEGVDVGVAELVGLLEDATGITSHSLYEICHASASS